MTRDLIREPVAWLLVALCVANAVVQVVWGS